MMKDLFSGLIAIILLGLYVFAVVRAVMIARDPDGGDLGDGFALVLQTVGGLVSALVVAVLAITLSGKTTLASGFLTAADKAAAIGWKEVLIGLYLLVWLLTGLAALVYGMLLYPKKVQTLTDAGQAWLGLAVAAAYALFGLSAS